MNKSLVLAAALCLGAYSVAHAGYVTPATGYVLAPPTPPTGLVLGNYNTGSTPTGNPNTIIANGTLGLTTSVSIHTYSDPNPIYGEVEYELVWTLHNPFSAPMYSVPFWLQTFGNLLQYDGGASGTVLDSTPWSTLGTLVAGSWTASGMVFNLGAGLQGNQSATFHLPLDVLGPGDGGSAASNVLATGSFQAVPEPGSLALCGIGLVALARQRWRSAL